MTPTIAIRRLLLVASIAALLAVVVGGPVGMLGLVAGIAALAVAAGVGMRAQWLAADPGPVEPAVDPALPDDVSAELRRLRAEHLARVDAALDHDRPDLARALVEQHQEQLRRLQDGAGARTA